MRKRTTPSAGKKCGHPVLLREGELVRLVLAQDYMAFHRSKSDIHNLPEKKEFRKELRSELTPAEAALWGMLKNSKVDGRKFRRQHSVGSYILDFYCPAEKLAVELDGYFHYSAEAMEYDCERRHYLESHEINVVRSRISECSKIPNG